jgi:hypothetical protein
MGRAWAPVKAIRHRFGARCGPSLQQHFAGQSPLSPLAYTFCCAQSHRSILRLLLSVLPKSSSVKATAPCWYAFRLIVAVPILSFSKSHAHTHTQTHTKVSVVLLEETSTPAYLILVV